MECGGHEYAGVCVSGMCRIEREVCTRETRVVVPEVRSN